MSSLPRSPSAGTQHVKGNPVRTADDQTNNPTMNLDLIFIVLVLLGGIAATIIARRPRPQQGQSALDR